MIKDEIKEIVRRELPNAINDIKRLIAVPSVRGEASPGKPFGPGPAKALEEALAIAKGLGFETKNVDGYAGYVTFGAGDQKIGILAHVDVVPEGVGWTHPPFEGEIQDGMLYGRGASDDKGPAIMALYAMKTLKDLGVQPLKEIRLVLGAAEETGMECAEHYLKTEGDHFSMGFSPDAAFPPIFGEKGLYRSSFSIGIKNDGDVKITSISAGEAPNMVCPQASATLEGPREKLENISRAFRAYCEGKAPKFEIALNGDTLDMTAYGKASHASTPQKGLSAIALLFEFLSGYITEPAIGLYNSLIGFSNDGQGLGIASEDQYGALTFVLGMANLANGKLTCSIDIRYPITQAFDPSKLKASLAAFGAEMAEGIDSPPLYVDPKAPFVQALANAYYEATGDAQEPISIGGATYARAFSNIVAFGSDFPGSNNRIHSADEFISIADCEKAIEIYASALLAMLDL